MGWSFGLVGLVLVGLAAWIVIPIVTSAPQGSSGQALDVEGYPLEVSATGDDGRTRVLEAALESDDGRGLDQLIAGDRIVVTGSGYDAGSGIYVAICQVPEGPDQKPGPCLGGVPATTPDGDATAGVIQWAPSNWINDDWAWRLFGARSFDDPEAGTFQAYIEVPGSRDESVDCRDVRCGLYTRNDHTKLEDRVQDLYLPVAFAG